MKKQVSPAILWATGLICSLSIPFDLRADVNPTVKALMPLLAPTAASKEFKPGDFKAVQDRMIRILEFLKKHDGSYGMDVASLVENAFYIYDRDRFSGHRRMMTKGAILRNWRTSQELGLFGKNGSFSPRITLGREAGKNIGFEYIVPPTVRPEFSTDLSNVRLVTPGTKRKKGAGLSAWDKAYASQLNNIEEEVLFGRPDELGRTRHENLALWKAEVEKAGEEFDRAPAFRLEGKVTATPSRKSGNRWRVSFEAANISRHPTQVKAEYFIFGISDKGNKIYLLAKQIETLKLRSSERREIDVWSDLRRIPMNLRGWVIRVTHEGKEIEWAASQPIIYDYLKRIGTIPRQPTPKKSKR